MFPLLGLHTAHGQQSFTKTLRIDEKFWLSSCFFLFIQFFCTLFVFVVEMFPKYFPECLVFCFYAAIMEVRKILLTRITFWVNRLPRAHHYRYYPYPVGRNGHLIFWIRNPRSLKTTMYYSPETTRLLRPQLPLSCAVSAPSRDLHGICHLSCCPGIFHSQQCVLRSHPCHRTRLLQILRQSTTGETQAERVRPQNGRMGFAHASHRSLVPACHCIHIFKTEFFKYNKQF